MGAKQRFGPKGAPKAKNAVTANVAQPRPTAAEFVALAVDEVCAKRLASRQRWAQIEELLRIEGYEVVADLFEHSIRKRR